jgi:hypothetical protein
LALEIKTACLWHKMACFPENKNQSNCSFLFLQKYSVRQDYLPKKQKLTALFHQIPFLAGMQQAVGDIRTMFSAEVRTLVVSQ